MGKVKTEEAVLGLPLCCCLNVLLFCLFLPHLTVLSVFAFVFVVCTCTQTSKYTYVIIKFFFYEGTIVYSLPSEI